MTDYPIWLPNMISCDGDIEKIIIYLYNIFDSDFKKSKPFFNNIPVAHSQKKRIFFNSSYEEGFLHLITKGPKNNRLFDNRRAERLPWCRPTIENCKDNAVLVWDYPEKPKKIRTYIWLKDFDYVVILQKIRRKNNVFYLLITAFYVSGNSAKRNLYNKYDNRIR
ncbi:hypothetical protein J7L68_07845 [bacterium]|nr:hypothetical protein [bacterium]